jgi:general secretion pathway protein G
LLIKLLIINFSLLIKLRKEVNMKKRKGFTLIELLVVIAIIGLLSTLAVIALNNARMKARDAKRVSDVKQIQSALELYYNDKNGYPASTTDSDLLTFMKIIPTNPTPSDASTTCPYTYAPIGSSPYSSYTLSYCLGGPTGGLKAGAHIATPSGLADDTNQ